MRFINFTKDPFALRMSQKLGDARTILDDVSGGKGGWEVWAQVETALQVNSRSNNYKFTREKLYPNSIKKCDFVVIPGTASSVQIWVELKVQLHSGLQSLATRFLTDVDKMLDSRDDFGENDTGGAISYAVSGARDYLSHVKNRIIEDERHKYKYIAFNGYGGQLVVKTLGAGNEPDNEHAVVVYRSILAE